MSEDYTAIVAEAREVRAKAERARDVYVSTVSSERTRDQHDIVWSYKGASRPEVLVDLLGGLAAAVESLQAERDAYKRAKAENDERFMRERDEARAERDEFKREMESRELPVRTTAPRAGRRPRWWRVVSTELDKIMAKLAAQGITIETRLAPGVPESDRPATRIRDAARRAGAYHESTDSGSPVKEEP